MLNTIRYTCEFDADEAEIINRLTDDMEKHVTKKEILRAVEFYKAIAAPIFTDLYQGILDKISVMTDEEWNDCVNRIPFDVPYTESAVIENQAGIAIKNWAGIEGWDDGSPPRNGAAK